MHTMRMIVHLTTSKDTLLDNIQTLRRIVKTVEQNHEIANNWIESAYREMTSGLRRDLKKAHQSSMDENTKSDVFIAEVTHSSFGVGYQVATALQQKKPTLLLSREGANNRSMVNGLDSTLVSFSEYNDDNLEKIVQDFLDENNIQSKDLRFNFFIDHQIYSYLRWASYKTGKPKAKILRDLVLQEIKKNGE